MLNLYAKVRYLSDREHGFPELSYYLEWMKDLVTNVIPSKKLFEEYRFRLGEVGILEERVSKIVKDIAPPLEYLETLKPFFSDIDKAQQKRERNARKLYSRRKAGEVIADPVGLQVFDILFDAF